MNPLKVLTQLNFFSEKNAITISSRLGYEKIKLMGLTGTGYVKASMNLSALFLFFLIVSEILLGVFTPAGLLMLIIPPLSLVFLLLYPKFAIKRMKMNELVSSIYIFDTFATVSCITGSPELASHYVSRKSGRNASIRFRKALFIMRNGTDPKKGLAKVFSEKHYSEWLRSVVYGSESDISPLLSYWNFEVTKGISKIEDTMAFFTVLSTLLPVVLSIMALIWGLGSSPWIFFLVMSQSLVFMVVYLWVKDLILPIE